MSLSDKFLNGIGLRRLVEKIKGLVHPNPALSGSEADLTGIEIDGTKYKVPSVLTVVYTQTQSNTITCNQEWQIIYDAITNDKPIEGWYITAAGDRKEILQITLEYEAQIRAFYEEGFNSTAGVFNFRVILDSYSNAARTISTGSVAYYYLPNPVGNNGAVLGVDSNAWGLASLKTINGTSLLGSGDISITTNGSFPSAWPTTSATTTKAFCDTVNADAEAIEGMSYLGEVMWSDLPSTLANCEVLVQIMSGTGTSGKVIHLVITSGNLYPYRWEYTYWNDGSNLSGWIGFQPEVLTVVYTKSGDIITCNQDWQTISDALTNNKPIQGWYVLSTGLVRAISKFVTSPSSTSIQQISVRFNLTADAHGNCTETELTDRYNSSTDQRTISTVIVGHSVLPVVNSSYNNYIIGVTSGQWDKTTLGAILSPNAQLAGTEPELTSLTIDATKYKVGGGTPVVANETLAGTEAELTEITVDGVKYKVASSNDFYQAVSTAQYGTPVNP